MKKWHIWPMYGLAGCAVVILAAHKNYKCRHRRGNKTFSPVRFSLLRRQRGEDKRGEAGSRAGEGSGESTGSEAGAVDEAGAELSAIMEMLAMPVEKRK